MAIFYFNYTVKFKDPPTFSETLALWLYLFGGYVVFVLTLSQLAMLSTGKSLDDLPLLWTVFGNAAAWYFCMGRGVWLLALLHRASLQDDENLFENLFWGTLGSFGTALLLFSGLLVILESA